MIYVLYDKPKNEEDMSFVAAELNYEYIELYPSERCNTNKKVFDFSKTSYKQLRNGDMVICWYDFMAVIIWWLSRLTHKDIQVLALNILLKDKNTLKNKAAKFLYACALKSKTFYATVTTKAYGSRIKAMLKINKDLYVLRDPYHSSYVMKSSIEEDYIFCGGRNGRDWKLITEIAKELPNVEFIFCMSEEDSHEYINGCPKNISIKSDICYEDFMEILSHSKIVALPLDTWAPAGLTVVFQAIANNKLVLISKTVSTEEYFSATPNLMCSSKQEWEEKITYYLMNDSERKDQAIMLKDSIETMCSEENYGITVNNIVTDTMKAK